MTRPRFPVAASLLRLGRLLRPAAPLIAALPAPWREDRLLERAGDPLRLDAGGVAELRAGAAVAFTAVGLGGWLAGVAHGAVLTIAGAGFGHAYPELWLRALAARRREELDRSAPLALDLVAASLAAGVGIDAALDGAAEASDGALREELRASSRSVALGRPRASELRDLAERTRSPALAALATALRLSDELGVPVAAAVRREAERARAARAREVQRRAAVAAPKMLLVVVLVLVPAALLPLAAALALSFAGALGSVGVG